MDPIQCGVCNSKEVLFVEKLEGERWSPAKGIEDGLLVLAGDEEYERLWETCGKEDDWLECQACGNKMPMPLGVGIKSVLGEPEDNLGGSQNT